MSRNFFLLFVVYLVSLAIVHRRDVFTVRGTLADHSLAIWGLIISMLSVANCRRAWGKRCDLKGYFFYRLQALLSLSVSAALTLMSTFKKKFRTPNDIETSVVVESKNLPTRVVSLDFVSCSSKKRAVACDM